MGVYWQVGVLALSLGLDNLSVAVGIGVQGISHRRALFIAILFAVFQTALPAAGIYFGHLLGPRLGDYAGTVGFAALTLLGLVTLFLALRHGHARGVRLHEGAGLYLAAAGVSLDSLAVGFSLALAGFPVPATIASLGIAALVMTWIGLIFGRHLSRRLEEWAEILAGAVLALTGVALLAHKLLGG